MKSLAPLWILFIIIAIFFPFGLGETGTPKSQEEQPNEFEEAVEDLEWLLENSTLMGEKDGVTHYYYCKHPEAWNHDTFWAFGNTIFIGVRCNEA